MKEVSLAITALDKLGKDELCLKVTFLGYQLLDRNSSLSMLLGDGISDRNLYFSLSRAETFSYDCNNWECHLTKKQVPELQILLEDFSDNIRIRFFPCIDIEQKKNAYYYDYLMPYKIPEKKVESLLFEIRRLHN